MGNIFIAMIVEPGTAVKHADVIFLKANVSWSGVIVPPAGNVQ